MTSRELRTRRRAEERRQKKNDRHPNPPSSPSVEPATPPVESSVSPEILAEFGPDFIAHANAMCDRARRAGAKRAAVNRANAAHSTGPKTVEGKVRSSRNSFKHGLYSQDLIILGEDPAEFDELRATLRDEHQPVNTTEEILVDELAQSFWRMRRFRHLEAGSWDPDKVNKWIDTGLMTLVQRAANSAERSFHKTLFALSKLQKERGFVPQKCERPAPQPEFEIENHAPKQECAAAATRQSGFVPEKIVVEQSAVVEEQSVAEETGFVPAKTASAPGDVPQRSAAELELFEYFGYFLEDRDKYVESLLEEAGHPPANAQTAA